MDIWRLNVRNNNAITAAKIAAKKLVDEIVSQEPRLQRVRKNQAERMKRLYAERARIDDAINAALKNQKP